MSKRAIITGGSAGIGLETAKKFYINGFDVMLCARNQENLNRAKQELEQLPSTGDSQEVRAIQADFSKERDVDRFASEVLASSGTIDVLVHNAGIFLPGDLVGEKNLQAMRDMMEVNFFSAYHLNQLLLPKMIEQGHGHIILMSSIAGLAAYPAGSMYTISKFALTGFAKALRLETQDKNIRVSAIYPGATWTRSWSESGLDEERLMPAEDIAQLVFECHNTSSRSVVEDIIIRPQLGDI
ncbi:MAG: SDR family oxidoreductase [Chitinophagales bacterium]